MKVIDRTKMDEMREDVANLYEKWIDQLEEDADFLRETGFDGDAHMHMILVYMSAARSLYDNFSKVVKNAGGTLYTLDVTSEEEEN